MKKVLCKCLKCEREFWIFECWYKRGNGKYCSRDCSSKALKEIEHKNYRIILKCKECGKEYVVKRHRKDTSKYCSKGCKRKNMPSGKNHPNWKGGISERDYRTKEWRRKVLERDLFACVECRSTNKEELNAHHIKEYSTNIELRFDINNGVTLCRKCHSKKHEKEANFILKGQIKSFSYKKCETCGIEFYVTPYKKESAKFCSKKCMYKSFNNGHYIKCRECNKDFYITLCQIKKGKKWCSWECYNKGRGSNNGKEEMGTRNKDEKGKPYCLC